MPADQHRKHIAVFLPPVDLLKRPRDAGIVADGRAAVKYRRVDLGHAQSASDAVDAAWIDRSGSRRGDDREETRDDDSDGSLKGDATEDRDGNELSKEAETTGYLEEEEGTSIAPPPSFHFALNRVTPVSEILAHPERYDGAKDAPPDFRNRASKIRLNLLVLIKEVGPLEQYEPKNQRNQAISSRSRWMPPALGHRSYLVVCDRDGSLLKITLWDRCARVWAGEEEESDHHHLQSTMHGEQSRHADASTQADMSKSGLSGSNRSATTEGNSMSVSSGRDALDVTDIEHEPPRALRPGDVVYLTKLIVDQRRDDAATMSKGGAQANTSLIRYRRSSSIQVWTTSESDVQLCFRADVRARRDEVYAYMGPERIVGSELQHLAAFDAPCRAVWQLARQWT
ncbi:hypothetical protein V8E36_006290 [Tilletia maclaganii]